MFSVHNVFARALRVVGSRYYGANETEQEKNLLSTTILYFNSDVLWGITNVWLLHKHGFLRNHTDLKKYKHADIR